MLTVLLLAPGRLNGEPATTSTTNVFGLPAPAVPNPLTRYPGRPGAKYEDVEARPPAAVQLGVDRLRLLAWSIVPHAALPARAVPARPGHYRGLGLVDGYAPSATTTSGDLLRVAVRMKPLLGGMPACVATVAADGTVLMPYELPAPKPARTTTTTAPSPARPVEVRMFFALGARRGRIYLTCRNASVTPLVEVDNRAVWGFDV